MLERSLVLAHVAQNASREPRVRIAVHKELHVEELADLRVVEDQNALDYEHIGQIFGLDYDKVFFETVSLVVIDWYLNLFAFGHVSE